MFPHEYEIRLRGGLSRSLRDVFAPMRADAEAGGTVTVLHGVVHDQSELTGILATIDSVGLVLLEVRPGLDPKTEATTS